MTFARVFVAVLVFAGAVLAACSGNFGSGTGPPGGLLPSGSLSGITPTPSPTPNSASNIATYGATSSFQSMPSVAGYGGAIAFTVPSPKPSGFDPIPVGVTLSIVPPTDAPDLNLATPGKQGKKRERPARPLAYVTLLATHDISLESYPRIAIDVPRDIATTYRPEEFGLALYNSGEKDKTYRLAAAELDSATPPPTPTPGPTAPPAAAAASPSASTTPVGVPFTVPTGGPLTPPPLVPAGTATGQASAPAASPTLPPQRILFAGTASPLKLSANRPVVFALYALPKPSAPPSAAASGAASPGASGSAAPAAAASGAGASSSAKAAASPSAGTPSPGPAAS